MGLGRVAVLAGIATALGGTGCGSSTTTTTVASGGIVTVVVTAPTSGSVINADSVTVRGTVSPTNATVQVQGHPAAVGNGIFSANANLHPGKTTIDVIGSAAGAAPGSTTITITRQSQGAAPPQAAPPDNGNRGGTPAPSPPGQTACGGGLSAGPNTSCAFAQNVQAAYRTSGAGTISVFSPATGQIYSMTCNNPSSGVVCTGGNNASVYFPG